MKPSFISNYEKACNLTFDFYRWLKRKGEFDVDIQYQVSFMSYFKHSSLNAPDVKVKGLKFLNNCCSFGSCLYETDEPFQFRLWYCTGGEDGGHHFKTIYFKDISEDVFLECLACMKSFFGLNYCSEVWVQLSLF